MERSESSRVPLGLIALMLIVVGGAVALVAGRSDADAPANVQPAAKLPVAPTPPKPQPRALEVPSSPRVSTPEVEPVKSEGYQAELERAHLAVEQGRYTEAANRLSVLAAQHLTEEGQKELQHCLQRTRVFSEPGFTKRCAMMVQERLKETTP